jgi:hypothetical protein
MLVRLDVAELRRELGDEVDGFIMDLANEIINEMKREAPVGATGDLRRSIQLFPASDQGVVYLGTRIGYAEDVWKGTDPHIADFEAITVWARRKLGSEAAAGPVPRNGSLKKSRRCNTSVSSRLSKFVSDV